MKSSIRLLALMLSLTMLCASCENAAGDSQAGAYLVIFEELASGMLSNIPNDRELHIAVDLTGVLHENPERIQAQIEDHLKEYSITLIWDDMDGLMESGHIIISDYGFPSHFENGFLVSFNDKDLDENKLITAAMVWYGNLGAHGATYTVSRKRSEWTIETTSGMWVS